MNRFRRLIQTLVTLGTNAYLLFPFGPVIYQGPLKSICNPGLHCYSCPTAVLACPVGALQHFMGSVRMSAQTGFLQPGLIVFGYLGFIGTLVGRFPCGWLCPFGLIQDLLHKIPSPKFSLPRFLSYGKYVILALLAILLPLLLVDQLGLGSPWFCKLLCPSGTLTGAVPLLLVKPSLWTTIGFYFWHKVFWLVVILVGSILISRIFCRVLCPLGAFYSLFNKVSVLQLAYDSEKCVHCLSCVRQCPTGLSPYLEANDAGCIRCLKCVEACRFGALEFKIRTMAATPAIRSKA